MFSFGAAQLLCSKRWSFLCVSSIPLAPVCGLEFAISVSLIICLNFFEPQAKSFSAQKRYVFVFGEHVALVCFGPGDLYGFLQDLSPLDPGLVLLR